MLTAEAIGGSGTVPPKGGGNNKLNPALVPASCTRRSFECGGPALDLLPGVIAVAVVRGPGGVTPESPLHLLLGAGLAGCPPPAIVRAALQGRACDACFASAAVALTLAQYAADRAVPSQ
jgi:hypothetical protein